MDHSGKAEMSLRGLHVSGMLYFGDGALLLTSCTVQDLTVQLEHHRRATTNSFSVIIDDCLIQRTRIFTYPTLTVGRDLNDYGNVARVELIIASSQIVDSFFNITGISVSIDLKASSFSTSAKSTMFPKPMLSITTGVDLNNSPELTPLPTNSSDCQTQKSAKTISQAVLDSAIEISNVNFSSFYSGSDIYGGALCLELYDAAHVEITNSSFTGNSRGLRFHTESRRPIDILITRCEFIGNHAFGPGGGVFIDQSQGMVSVKVQHCSFRDNAARSLLQSGMSMASALTQIVGSGGALAVDTKPSFIDDQSTRCLLVIAFCSFTNNTATSYGGTLYLTSEVDGHLHDNTFSNSPQPEGM